MHRNTHNCKLSRNTDNILVQLYLIAECSAIGAQQFGRCGTIVDVDPIELDGAFASERHHCVLHSARQQHEHEHCDQHRLERHDARCHRPCAVRAIHIRSQCDVDVRELHWPVLCRTHECQHSRQQCAPYYVAQIALESYLQSNQKTFLTIGN